MIKKTSTSLYLAAFLLLLHFSSPAQKTIIYDDNGIKAAYDLFEKQKYVSAQKKIGRAHV